MMSGGLQASRHASQTAAGDLYRVPRNEWTCPTCGSSNMKTRVNCFRCVPSTNPGREIDRSTPIQNHGYEIDVKVKPFDEPPPPYSQLGPGECGLATSRWAPRNCKENTETGERRVWTRTVSVAVARPPLQPVSTTPAALDVQHQLPYEVQHYILATIQRILEEGTYEFALRWIPEVLKEKGWTCPEIVELKTWKSVLPEVLPARAIPNRNSLPAALGHAVKIRNSAAHRHLCDNIEIKQMARQAQFLMSLFDDITRQGKFDRLWNELVEWDRGTGDADTKRLRLETALRDISERPLDDMDWTPNALSLQELQPGGTVQGTMSEGEYGDAMEID